MEAMYQHVARAYYGDLYDLVFVDPAPLTALVAIIEKEGLVGNATAEALYDRFREINEELKETPFEALTNAQKKRWVDVASAVNQ